jgi:hypothetical protein
MVSILQLALVELEQTLIGLGSMFIDSDSARGLELVGNATGSKSTHNLLGCVRFGCHSVTKEGLS